MRQEMAGFLDAMASAGPYANNLHLSSDPNHTTTSSLNFYRPDAVPDAELSMGWVDPWVGLGWVELGRDFSVLVGWVHYTESTKN